MEWQAHLPLVGGGGVLGNPKESIKVHLTNLYLILASFTYVTRLMLFLAHHLEGAY